jgi:uncharacterized membrane protein YhaH (DUF805 family)
MTEEGKSEKFKEYTDRNTFWTTQAVNQFSFSNNLFLTFGIGILAYLVGQRHVYGKFILDFTLSVYWPFVFYLIAFLSIFISILSGAVVTISRLRDMRISRRISLIRKRVFNKIDLLLPEDNIDISDDTIIDRIKSLFSTTYPVIPKLDVINKEAIAENFDLLRKRSKLLGSLSWKAHMTQIISLLFTTIVYGLMIVFG